MDDLRRTFGLCVKAHRRRLGLTQENLADAANISLDMVAKIEGGSSGASFGTIEQLAHALSVDAYELFRIDHSSERFGVQLTDIVTRLAALSDDDLVWVNTLLDAALKPRRKLP
ncbi:MULTISPECIES: helix-turn-helix domain-containing protein [unclassified Agrobacterium]|uniref:helix-turn-helix domain-containing protein n=1 Tax=unclassified Agrobacterium TaxID=2632611 RepID=UPI00036A3D26|nr:MULTISPECIES: helix-turn-helix transcriptional regulator [unclassified Agrobacterium]SNB61994.1 Predicted transcription factor, homolog of eukaryotic MBF1 [Agrobacterium sp. 719_389]